MLVAFAPNAETADGDRYIQFVAGTPRLRGFSGDNGPATKATLSIPRDVAVDAVGNIYISDSSNHRIRCVRTTGIIETCAGTGERGFGGDNGPATASQLNSPQGLAVGPDQSLYIADRGNNQYEEYAPMESSKQSQAAAESRALHLESPSLRTAAQRSHPPSTVRHP